VIPLTAAEYAKKVEDAKQLAGKRPQLTVRDRQSDVELSFSITDAGQLSINRGGSFVLEPDDATELTRFLVELYPQSLTEVGE
jgi:hypothetical protein